MRDQQEVTSPALRTRHVFIVGVSRSGTTLMMKTLNTSDEVAISNENHFLGHLLPWEGARHQFRRFGDLRNDENVHRLVDFIYSGAFAKSSRLRGLSRHWRWIIKKVGRDDLQHRILDSDRTERALFEIMMQVYAEGRPVIGEKTPAHVRYVPTIMAWFPDARVIHMLRDPRAVFVSELRRRKREAVTVPYKQLSRIGFLFKLFIMLETTLAWRESATLLKKYRRLYPDRYYLLRFEDLVSEPEPHIRALCAYLGISFQQELLNQIVVSKGFQAGQSGFDAQAAQRWQKHIDPWIERWYSFWFESDLKSFGYSPTRSTDGH